MKLIHKTRNEVYEGSYDHNGEIITAIFKYHNDINSKEEEILKYLNKKDPNLRVPKIYYSKNNVISPSGKTFAKLVVMELIISSKRFTFDNGKWIIDRQTRHEIFKSMKETVHRLHEFDIYHMDATFDNMICGPKGEWYLIDFGSASDKFNMKFSNEWKLAQDNFNLLDLLRESFPPNWENMPTNKLTINGN